MANRRRFLAILLSLLMLLQALPMSALAEGWNVARSNIEEGATYHTVTFEVEDTAVATQLIESGHKVSTFPEDPFKAGYQFDGWFVEDAEFTFSTPVSANTTVEAKFTPIDAYEVTIEYVDEEGAEVADSIVRSYLVTDASDVIESPASVVVGEGEGQRTLYPDQASVTITPADLPAADEDADKKVAYTVIYAESNATYTVRHFLKNLGGEGYTEIENTAQILNGVVGSSPVPDPLSTETYPYIEYEKYDPATVAEGGSTVINVYYTRKNVTLTYDSQGGSYIAPKFAPYGSTVEVYSFVQGELTCGREEHTHSEEPLRDGDRDGETSGCWTWNDGWFGWNSGWELSCGKSAHTHTGSCYAEDAYNPAPTRTGYTFAGWYTDSQCNTPASAQTVLNGNQTVYAKWEAGQADYTIVYMKQVYDNATNQKRYVYHSSSVGTGTVGQTVTVNGGVNISRQKFSRATSAVIKADSSTVVYAYYDLIEYTIIFDLTPGNTRVKNPTITMNGQTYEDDEYRLTVVLGQDISALWPTPDKVTTDSGHQLDTWNGNYKTIRFEVTDDMLPNNGQTSITYDAAYTTTSNQKIVRYWLETTDGSRYEVSDNYSQVFIQPSNDSLDAKNIYGFTKGNRPSGYPSSGYADITFKGETYWNIMVYNFYYDRSQYDITYYYGTQGLGDHQNVYFGADISGDTYDWQPTPTSVGLPADYTFAGWYDNAECLGDPYAFTTMPANNLALYAKFTPPQRTVTLVYYDGEKDGTIVVTYGETVESLPQQATRPGYTFLGWFTDPAATEPFDINQPITENMTIYAGWQRNALEYTVRYLEKETNEPLLPEQTIRNDAYTEGLEVTASAITISGYRVDAMTKSINLNIDPSQNVITFYYAPRQDQEYSVHYYVQGTQIPVAASKTEIASAEVERVVEMAVAPTVPEYEDYYPIEKVKTATVTTSLREIIFYYAPYGTVTYIINHVDKNGGVIPGEEPQTITKKIGDSIQPEDYKRTITGYTFDHVEDGKEYLVAEASEPVEVNLYYARTFTVTYDKGDHGSLAGDDDNDGKIIHANIPDGATTPAAPTVTAEEGYYFTGWYPEIASTVTGDVTYTAKYAEKHEITVVAKSDKAKYDGKEKSVSGFETLTFEVEGNTYTVEGLTASATETDAGEYPAVVTGTAVVKDADGDNVTDRFTVKTENGKLTITKRNVTLTSESASKEYDGKPLTNHEVTVGGDGFAEGEGFAYDVTGSQTLVGSSENIFTYAALEGTELANYMIATRFGTLTVVDESVDPNNVVTKTHKDKEYDLNEIVTFTILVTNIYDEVKTITLGEIEGVTLEQSVFEDVQPGETIEAKATYQITESDILKGSFVNTVTATFSDGGTFENTDTVDPMEPNGHLTINKETTSTPANGTGYALGETITYEIKVVNDGTLTITDITVTDELTGDEWTIPSLKPGAEQTFNAEYVVTEADILAGSVENVATATGTSPDPENPEVPVTPGEEEDPTEEPNGHLMINKETTSTPANGESYALGETITYEITVVNDGNLTLTDITVTDDLTGDEWTIPSLEPGAEQTFNAEYVVTEADILAGSVENVATATGTSPDPENPEVPVTPGEEEDPTEEPNGHLMINKETTSTPANGESYALGETITYEITVVNDGNLTLTDITVTDDLTGDEWTIPSLEPGAEQTFNAEYVVTEADILAGSVENVATATGTSPDPDDPDPGVDPGEEDTPTENKNGHLTIEKETTGADANNDGVYEEGETIRYLIRVINDGNLTITDITVTDELTGDEWTIPSLEPGAEQIFTTSHVVSSADGAAGVVVNVATATGTSPDPEQPDVPVTPGTEEVPTEEDAIRTDLTARINYVYIGNSALNRTERLYDLTQGEVITDIGSRVLRNTIDGYTVSRIEGLPMTVRVTESRNVITVYYEPQILTEILDLEVPTGSSLGSLNVGDCCE